MFKVLYEYVDGGIAIVEYRENERRHVIPNDFGQRDYGSDAAQALRDALERINAIGYGDAMEERFLRSMRGWSEGEIKVIEVRVGGQAIRAFAIRTTDITGIREALVLLRLCKLKGGMTGGYKKYRSPVMKLAARAVKELKEEEVGHGD